MPYQLTGFRTMLQVFTASSPRKPTGEKQQLCSLQNISFEGSRAHEIDNTHILIPRYQFTSCDHNPPLRNPSHINVQVSSGITIQKATCRIKPKDHIQPLLNPIQSDQSHTDRDISPVATLLTPRIVVLWNKCSITSMTTMKKTTHLHHPCPSEHSSPFSTPITISS